VWQSLSSKGFQNYYRLFTAQASAPAKLASLVFRLHHPSCGHASAVFLASTKPSARQCCCCLFAHTEHNRAAFPSIRRRPRSRRTDWRHTIDKPAATRPSGSGYCDAINMPMLPNRVMSDVRRSTSRDWNMHD